MTKKIFWTTILAMALTQISPLVTETPKFFCYKISEGLIQCGSIEFAEKSFFYIRLAIILGAVLLYGLIQYYQTYQPLKKYNAARKDVLDVLLAPNLDDYISQGFSLRINVMKARRFLILWHKLDTIYHYGFEPKHRDTHLSFWVCRLINYAQGNSGQAFIKEKPQLADLTEGVPYKYHMSKEKIKKSTYIKGIISIPVFELMSQNTTPKVLGVINIDTNDEGLVRDWIEDQECLTSIIDAFENHAKIVSHFI